MSSLLALILFMSIPQTNLAGDIDDDYIEVKLNKFLQDNRPHKKGGKSIVPPKNISFFGQVMQLPKTGKFKYVYMAMELMQVVPTPEITHQMYISDKDGNVVSMYVEKNTAKIFNQYINVGDNLHFKGFHIYNYKRGPAIVIDGLVDDITAHSNKNVDTK